MKDEKSLLINDRKENIKDQRESSKPLVFTLKQIKQQFDSDMDYLEHDIETLIKGEEHKKYILRSQIVFLEASLDFYIHSISQTIVYKMLNGDMKLTTGFEKYKIPMSVVMKGLADKTSFDWFLKYNSENGMATETYLSSDSLGNQLSLLGINLSNVLKNHCSFKGEAITRLFNRRNAIAHQGDRRHINHQENDIDRAYVRSSINMVKELVAGINKELIDKICIIRADFADERSLDRLKDCLSCADAMDCEGYWVHFICRAPNNDPINQIKKKGYKVHNISKLEQSELENYYADEQFQAKEFSEIDRTLSDINRTGKDVSKMIIDSFIPLDKWKDQFNSKIKDIDLLKNIKIT